MLVLHFRKRKMEMETEFMVEVEFNSLEISVQKNKITWFLSAKTYTTVNAITQHKVIPVYSTLEITKSTSNIPCNGWEDILIMILEPMDFMQHLETSTPTKLKKQHCLVCLLLINSDALKSLQE